MCWICNGQSPFDANQIGADNSYRLIDTDESPDPLIGNGVVSGKDSNALLTIDPRILVSDTFGDITKGYLGGSNELTYHINQASSLNVEYFYTRFTGWSEAYFYGLYAHWRLNSAIKRLDKLLGLDFKEIKWGWQSDEITPGTPQWTDEPSKNGEHGIYPGEANIKFYHAPRDGVYAKGFDDGLMGIASDEPGGWVIGQSDISNTTGPYASTTTEEVLVIGLHELGHALGLSHPNEDPTNPAWNAEDTVMSYNAPSDGWEGEQVTWGWEPPADYYLFYSDADISALRSIWGAEFPKNSYEYKISNLGDGAYGVKTEEGVDVIYGDIGIEFKDQNLDLNSDIKATFDQVTGMDEVNGVIFRLYNAAFSRLPDPGGLRNWINQNESGGFSYKQTAKEFINSQESINRYGSNQSNTDYITTVYNNILDRDPDSAGLSHYEGLLGSGEMSRAEMMFAFSESPENRILFTEVTGIG